MSTDLTTLYTPLYGSLYFSTVLSTAFYGVTCMQTFFYYVHYESDPFYMKAFVAIMCSLNTIHEALAVAGAYKLILSGLLNRSSPANWNPELVFLYLVTALISVPTQAFYVRRIYVFSRKNIILAFVLSVLALVQLVTVLIYAGKALYIADGVIKVVDASVLSSSSFLTLATLALGFSVGVDILIAISMTFLLIRERAASRFGSTAHILERLTVFAVNTGIGTATFAILSLVLSLALPESNPIFLVFGVPLGSIYFNALLGNLNARAYIRNDTRARNVDMGLMDTKPSSRALDKNEEGRQQGNVRLFLSTTPTVEVVQLQDVDQFTMEKV